MTDRNRYKADPPVMTKEQERQMEAERAAQYDCANACSIAPANPHALIQERIEYHNRMSNTLWALYRALPSELPRDAADALATVLIEARPRY